MRHLIAIDPGLRGAAAEFTDGKFAGWWPLAEVTRQRDLRTFRVTQCVDADVFIEALLAVPYRSVQATMTTASGWGALRARVEASAKSVVDVPPRTWQADLKLSAKRGESKADHKRRIAYMVRAHLNMPDLPIYATDAVAIGIWALHRAGDGVRPAA